MKLLFWRKNKKIKIDNLEYEIICLKARKAQIFSELNELKDVKYKLMFSPHEKIGKLTGQLEKIGFIIKLKEKRLQEFIDQQ